MSGIEGRGFRLRRATLADLPYLTELAAREEVEPFLAARSPWEEEPTRAAIAAQESAPADEGRLILEVEGEAWQPAGALAFSVQNRRSRIAYLFGVMVEPAFRGRRLAERSARLLAEHLIRELGYHRVQLEVYGFNDRARRAFERAGFVTEGARRRAYWRHGAWHDGVLFALTEEDLDE